MSTFELQHFKNQELAKAYMQGVHDITEWLLKPSERTATNFDKVTASPEALAEFIYKVQGLAIHRYDTIYPWCMVVINSGKTCPANCANCITEWLKQEAKETEK